MILLADGEEGGGFHLLQLRGQKQRKKPRTAVSVAQEESMGRSSQFQS